jgi:zinc-finger of transposase IS204/IS1001/IS1096/IS1165
MSLFGRRCDILRRSSSLVSHFYAGVPTSMSSSPFLPLPPGLEILTTTTVDNLLRVEVASTRSHSRCPLCFHSATRIPSRYTRVVAAAPCAGFKVQLVLQVRKFFCDTPECPRKITTRAAICLCPALGADDDPALSDAPGPWLGDVW